VLSSGTSIAFFMIIPVIVLIAYFDLSVLTAIFPHPGQNTGFGIANAIGS